MLGFIGSGLLFYIVKIIFDVGGFDKTAASILQAILYLSFFGFLTSAIGLLFRDSYEQFKWNTEEEKRPLKIRQKLIDFGYIEVDLEIQSTQTFMFDSARHPPNWSNAFYIIYKTSSGIFGAVIDSRTTNILNVEERQSQQSLEDLKEQLLNPSKPND